MPERFEIYIVYKRRYINTLPFLFLFFHRLLAPRSGVLVRTNSFDDFGAIILNNFVCLFT